MSIGKIIKTGLAIYGGTVLAKKIGRYLFVKNKDKIAAKVKEKIIKACDKAIDEVFKDTTPKNEYFFKASEIAFHTADSAYYIRQRMIDTIHARGKATVDDYKDLAVPYADFLYDSEDCKWGWTNPDIFEMAPIERVKNNSAINGYEYYIDVRHPDKLEDI